MKQIVACCSKKKLGRIVFFSLGGFCSHAYKAKIIAEAGAVGAIFGQLSVILPSWDSMAQDQELAPQLTIPVNFVGVEISNYIIRSVSVGGNSTPLVATMTYQQDPIFEFTQGPSFSFIQCLFCIWFGVFGVISLIKLCLFVQEQGQIHASVPQVCLFLCLFTCIISPLYFTLNLFGSRNSTSQVTMVVFREWVPLVWLMPVIVFPFYWGELIASSQPVVGLKESKLPFLIAIFIIEGFTLAVAVVKGLYGSNPDLIRAQICTVVILCGLFGIYFVIQGIRVIIVLGRMQDGFGRTSIQRRTTFLFLCLAILLFAFTANYACSFASGIGYFQEFLAYEFFFLVFAALAMSIIVSILSPKALKEAGAKMTSSIFSGTSMRAENSKSSDAVEMDKPPKKPQGSIDEQMAETKITI